MAVCAFKLCPSGAFGEPSPACLLVVLALAAHKSKSGGPSKGTQSLAFGVQVGLELGEVSLGSAQKKMGVGLSKVAPRVQFGKKHFLV